MKFIKKLPFWRNYTTSQWNKWWAKRKIDWKASYLDTWKHPHRQMISAILTRFKWMSLLEVGCGPGANLVNIVKNFPGRQVGGVDINPEAIDLAKETFNGAFLKVGSMEDIMMSDNSADVVLTDMCLIYFSNPDKAIKEIKRIARNHIVLCELHTDSLWSRIKVLFQSGYHLHNYKKLLDKYGFYDIEFFKIPPEIWDSKNQKSFGYVIVAKVPRRKL